MEHPPHPIGRIESRIKVLLIDDNDDIREVFGTGLELLGCRTAGAATGQEAIEHFLAFQPDVVLVDQGLPDMLGIEVGQKIRAMEPRTDVVLALVTGTDGQGLRELASDSGFDGFFVKPVKIQTIFDWITSSLTTETEAGPDNQTGHDR